MEEAADVRQGRLWLCEEGEESVPQEVFPPRPPGVEPGLLENFDKSRDRKGALRGRDGSQGVEAHGIARGGVEEDEIRSASWRQPAVELLYQIAVRVHDRAAVTLADVLPEQGLKESGLAGAGLSNHIHMGAAVGALDAEEAAVAAEVGAAEEGEMVIPVLR